MATLGDVAAMAGVSISAVSRVLSNSDSARVSAETRARIHAAATTLSYRPNFAGRALKSARTNVIALVVPDLTNAVFTDLMRGVEDAAYQRGYVVLLARAEDMRPGGKMIDKLLGEARVDAVMLQVGDHTPSQVLESMRAARTPTVLVNSAHPGFVGSVSLDDREGAAVAARHLVALGHERIGLINGLPTTFTARMRGVGFAAALQAGGLTLPARFRTDLGYEPLAGREALRAVMGQAAPPTAVFVANVNAAIGALAEARSMGLRIPEDLSVVAMHDAWTAENTWPPLTTIKMPLLELGRRGVEMIDERLSGATVGDVVIDAPAPQLIARESTARLR